ncbi:MAG: pilus assembly protein, partial [Mailhella sp.]|nr:pilus assembly protein [Mailhella sp.]
QAYIAGMTMATSEYNQTSEITPGEVASGFSMTLVPHIQADKRVLLHYNVTLSSLDGMEVIDKDSVFVQLPKISSRSFSQRSAMQLGQTLVLAGFEQASQTSRNNVGLFNSGRDTAHTKTLIIVTIELESAESV